MAVNKRVVMREVRKLRMEEEAVPKPEAKGLVVKVSTGAKVIMCQGQDYNKSSKPDIHPDMKLNTTT